MAKVEQNTSEATLQRVEALQDELKTQHNCSSPFGLLAAIDVRDKFVRPLAVDELVPGDATEQISDLAILKKKIKLEAGHPGGETLSHIRISKD